MFIPSCKKDNEDHFNKFLNENMQFKWHFNYGQHTNKENNMSSISYNNYNNDFRIAKN